MTRVRIPLSLVVDRLLEIWYYGVMMNEKRDEQTAGPRAVASSGGIGLGGITFIVLLVLKILGHLPMVSWLAVLTAWIWVPLLIIAVMAVIFFVAYMVLLLIQWVAEGSQK